MFLHFQEKVRAKTIPRNGEALIPAPPPSSLSLPFGDKKEKDNRAGVDASATPSLGEKLRSIVDRLDKEYLLRRRVMLRRLDVTIQAFLWSKKAQVKPRGKLGTREKAEQTVGHGPVWCISTYGKARKAFAGL